jgi:hypothetical protein
MRKTKALRLRPGHIICFGNHERTERCTKVWEGEVLSVSLDGTIKVKVTDARPWIGPTAYAQQYGNMVRLVPYRHVLR